MSGLLLLGLLACGGGDPAVEGDPVGEDQAPSAEAPAERVLDDQAYWFCHVDGMDAREAEAYCPLLEGQPEDFCPGLRATCEGAPPKVSASGCNEGGGGSSSGRPAGDPDRPGRAPRESSCEAPDTPSAGLAAVAKWTVALIVALFLVFIVRMILKYAGFDRKAPDVEPVLPPVEEEVEEPVLDDVPDLPSDDLLAASRKALAEGRYGEAVLLARGAALRRLGDAGRLRLHRSKTDREYARAVRREASIHAALREVLAAVEVHRWGGAPLDRQRSESAVAAAATILQAIAGVLLLVGLMWPAAAAANDRYGPNGDAALKEVLTAWGHDAGFRLRGLDSLDDTVDVVVLDTTWVAPDEAGWEALEEWVVAGGVLWVAGPGIPFAAVGQRRLTLVGGLPTERGPTLKALGLPAPVWPGGVGFVFVGHTADPWVRVVGGVGPVAPDPLVDEPLPEPIERPEPSDTGGGAGEDPDDGGLPAVYDPVGHGDPVVSFPLGEGRVVAMADARVLWNGAYVHPDNEVFTGDWMHAAQGALGWQLSHPIRVELATTATASSPSPSQSILNADLMPFVIQLLITWILLALWKGVPFGILRDPPEAGRLSFADHVRALGTRWFRTGASRYALAAYAGLWLQRLGAGGIRQAALRAGRDKHRADALLTALQAAVEDPTGPSSDHDFEWMEELWTITKHR